MNFLNPSWLWLLLLIPPFALIHLGLIRLRIQKARELYGERSDCSIAVLSFRQYVLGIFLFGISLSAIWVAAAQPRWGYKVKESSFAGADIMLAVDVSRSMDAQDVKPSRLEQAKRQIIDFLGALNGDRVGLLLFSGRPFMQCPLTNDYGALRLFLDAIQTGVLPVSGSDLGAAIREGASRLSASSPSETAAKVLIIMSDGEDHNQEALAAARRAASEGVRIFTIGLGTQAGAPIPSDSGFIKDENGQMVMSRLKSDLLQDIALEGRGAYLSPKDALLGVEEIYKKYIRPLEGDGTSASLGEEGRGIRQEKIWTERFQIFTLAGLLILLCQSIWLDNLYKRLGF